MERSFKYFGNRIFCVSCVSGGKMLVNIIWKLANLMTSVLFLDFVVGTSSSNENAEIEESTHKHKHKHSEREKAHLFLIVILSRSG